MITNNLLDRQINVGNNLTSSYYSNKIIKNYYDSTDYLYRYEVDIPSFDSDSNDDINSEIDSVDCEDPIEDLSFSPDGNYMVLSDERNLLFYDLKESYSFPTPTKIKSDCNTIFKLCFNNDSSKIIYTENNCRRSGYNIHLIDVNSTATEKDIYIESTVRSLSANPINSNIILFSDFRKKLFTHDFRSSEINRIKIKNFLLTSLTTSLLYYPQDENLVLVSTDNEHELFTFDLRNSQVVKTYKLPYYNHYLIDRVCFNKKGTQILVAKRGVGPILFNINENLPAFEFDEFGYHTTDYNNHFCFAGIDDEYIVSGSHNFDVFMWEIPKKNSTKNYEVLLKRVNKAKFVLKGHISIVNKVYYNHSKSILASIAWDKLIFWSCLPLYSEFKNYETIPETYISQEVNLIYLPYLEKKTIKITKFFYLEDEELFVTENQFYYSLNDIFDIKTLNLEKFFAENLSIRFIYLFLLDFKMKSKIENLNLLKNLKNLLNNLEDGFKGNKQKWYLLIECKKVFVKKLILINCIEYLTFYIRLFVLKKEKMTSAKNLTEDELNVKLKSLEKINFIMKAMVYDLIIIFKMNIELYEISYEVIKKFIERVGFESDLNTLFFDFTKSIFKKNFVKNDGLSMNFQESSSSDASNESYNYEISSNRSNSNSFSSSSDASNESFNQEISSNRSNSNSFSSSSNDLNSTFLSNFLDHSAANDLKYIYTHSYYQDSEESLLKKKKVNDQNDEKLKFCFKLNKKKSLNLLKQYDDNFLKKLSNDINFEEKFKEEFSSLKEIEKRNLISLYSLK